MKKENEKLRKANTTNLDEYKEHLEMLQTENKKTEEILRDRNNYVHDLQVSHNTIEQENNKLTFQYEEAKYYIEKLENELNEIKQKLEDKEFSIKVIKKMAEVL
jgi:chromosome segregation ATPase